MSTSLTNFEKYQKLLESLPENLERIDVMNNYSWELSRIDPIRAFDLAEKANVLSNKLNDKIGVAKSLRNLGQSNLLMSNLKGALEKGLACIAELENQDDSVVKIDALNIIGSVYAQSGDFENAHLYYANCVELRRKLNDNEGEVRALNSIGDLYLKTKEYDKAEDLFLQCLEIQHNNHVHKGIVLYNLGETCFYLKKEEKAFEYLHKSIKIGEELNFTLMNVYCSLLLGQIYFSKNDYPTSIKYLSTALAAAIEVDSKDRIYLIHKNLSKAYKKLNDFENALIHHEKYHQMKEVVFNEDNNQKIKTMQFQFQTQALKKEAEFEKNKNLELQTAYDKIERQRDEIKDKNQDITDSINYAQKIQQAILPDKQLLFDSFCEAFVLYQPKDIVSGDFYWINKINETLIVGVIDCTGHGVPGAFMSVMGHSHLSQIVIDQKILSPSDILNKLDEKIGVTLKHKSNSHDSNDGMDMALISFDAKSMTVRFSGAKNALYLIRGKELTQFKGDKFSIGGHDAGQKKFNLHEIKVSKGDLLYLTTDGYADQFGGPRGKKFKGSKLRELLVEISNEPMADQHEMLRNKFWDWKSNLDQVDDVCLVGMKI